MKAILYFFLLFFTALHLQGQNKTVDDSLINEEEVYTFVEQMPEPKGGNKKLLKVLQEAVRYDSIQMDEVFDSRVIFTFIVDTLGVMRNLEINSGAFGVVVNQKALEQFEWNPGMHNGKVVNVRMRIPVTICLE